MGVQTETDGALVILRSAGRIEDRDVTSWPDRVREAARAAGGQVSLLVVVEQGIDISVPQIAAATRGTFGVVHLIRASALVGLGAVERSILRAAALLVGPVVPIELFDDEASARAWLAEIDGSRPTRISHVDTPR